MIIVIDPSASERQLAQLQQEIEQTGCFVNRSADSLRTIFGLTGDVAKLDQEQLLRKPGVENVLRLKEPYKKANRLFRATDTLVQTAGQQIGGDRLTVIAGPCSVESEAQIVSIAEAVKAAGAGFLRGGAFKPRSSPYSFQGLKEEGLELLKIARAATGLPIVSEIMSVSMLERFEQEVDVLQIGARNMQNFDLLKAVGQIRKPVLLKRGMSATIEEWLMAAEYIAQRGNLEIVLCERGIRTFETATRNTLDISAVPVVQGLSHLPVIVDPSHSGGRRELVAPLSRAAVAVGADGVIIDVHPDPRTALCDGPQALTADDLGDLSQSLAALAAVMGRGT